MRIGIAGAGVMGQLLAWEFARAGCQVDLFDHGASRNCSQAAAGMLSPISELEKCDKVIYDLGLDGLQGEWSRVLSTLPQSVEMKREGSLVVSHRNDRNDLLHFIQTVSHKIDSTQSIRRITSDDLSLLEPDINHFPEAYFLEDEGQIDNQSLMLVLEKALQEHENVTRYDASVIDMTRHTIKVGEQQHHYDLVCDCRGLGAKNKMTDLRGVRGELIWLHAPDVNLQRPVRFMHPRYRLYVVPRANNIYLVGASEIETSDTSDISVRTMLELLTAAYCLQPKFAEARIIKSVTQVRPTFTHHLPKICYADGYLSVNGLYRHGFLIAPALIADVMRWMNDGVHRVKYPSLWSRLEE